MQATDPLYFIAIIPPKEISEVIKQYKEDMANRFFSKAATKSPPHITLHMPFRLPDKKLEKLKGILKSFTSDISSFNLQLKEFGCFPPRVIFVGVQENEYLEEIQKGLLKTLRKNLNLFNGDYKERAFHPHMTIAFRDLKPRYFKLAWEEYQSLPLSFDFSVEVITLLKHNGKTWEIYEDFELSRQSDTI